MQSSATAKWVVYNPFKSHVLVPGLVSLVLIGMYFSGSVFLQGIVAPTVDAVEFYSQREFGTLEMLQNFILLGIFFYAVRCFLATRDRFLRVFLFLLLGAVLFQFVEEIDYGAHFVELLTELDQPPPGTWERNIHNWILLDGTQVSSYLKLVASIVIVGGFVLAPLVADKFRNQTLRLLVPSRWCIATVALMIVLSRLAHLLDDAGMGIIDGVQGKLYLNISEFRELNLYFLLLLYILTLFERITAANEGMSDNP